MANRGETVTERSLAAKEEASTFYMTRVVKVKEANEKLRNDIVSLETKVTLTESDLQKMKGGLELMQRALVFGEELERTVEDHGTG
jgi:hypothetical protein